MVSLINKSGSSLRKQINDFNAVSNFIGVHVAAINDAMRTEAAPSSDGTGADVAAIKGAARKGAGKAVPSRNQRLPNILDPDDVHMLEPEDADMSRIWSSGTLADKPGLKPASSIEK